MHEFGVVAKDVVEKAKDVKEVAQELGDKKVYGDITVKAGVEAATPAVLACATGGAPAVAIYVGGRVLGAVGKELALEAGCSEKTASNIERVTRIGGSVVTGAVIDGVADVESIGEVGSEVANKLDTSTIDYDVPVVQAGELSGISKNLIASDTICGVSELDFPVVANVENPNEAVTGVVAKFGDGKLSEDITNIESNLIKIDTRNQALEGTVHPETGVPFVRKVIDIGDGMKVEGVFPDFDSKFDVQLPEDMLKSSDVVQFNECNNQLKEAVEASIDKYKSIFNDEQIEQILSGETPDGYTWHHDAEVGKMQLVDSDIHMKTGHTGGRTVWGGGNENR